MTRGGVMMGHVLWASLVVLFATGINAPACAADAPAPATRTEKAEVAALHAAAQACAGMIEDDYARSGALIRLAEVERIAGVGAPAATLAEAEKAARRIGDQYHLALALCDLAEARQAGGNHAAELLVEAESAAEEMRVETKQRKVIWDEFRAVALGAGAAIAGARSAAYMSPFMPPPDDVEAAAWYAAPPSARAGMLTTWVYEDYSRRYAARREAWEAQQRHLRDLARARLATARFASSGSQALEVADRISDAALRSDTILTLAWMAAPSEDHDAVALCLRALETAGTAPPGTGRIRARTRAVCALLVAAPEQAAAPLSELREEIGEVSDAALRVLMLGDLAVAAKTHDDALAADLYGDAIQSLKRVGSVDPFAALAASLGGAQPQAPPTVMELMQRGFGLLDAGFKIDPARAAEGCEVAFQLIEATSMMPAGVSTHAPLSYLQQWGLLRLLAAHDPDRALALTESGGRRLTRAWGLASVAEALIGSDPERAGDLLDRAWTLSEDARRALIDEVGVERNGELKIPSQRSVSRKSISEQWQLLGLAQSLAQAVAAQCYLGVLTHRAIGDKSLALDRCTHALDTIRIVPKHVTDAQYSPPSVLTAAVSGIAVAATTYVDLSAGRRTAAEVRQRLRGPARAQAAATAAQYLAHVDPVSTLEYVAEALENAPAKHTGTDLRGLLSRYSVMASFERVPDRSGESVDELARRVTSLSERRRSWAPAVASALTELTQLYAEVPTTPGSDAAVHQD